MSTMYHIIVENHSANAQEFYFFQQPAIYSGGDKVYTNSVGHDGLPAYKEKSVNQLQFFLEQQYYAGVQKQLASPITGQVQIGQVSQVEIDLASEKGESLDCTKLEIDDTTMSLTDPVSDPTVQEGAFRIKTPIFNPAQQKFNVGLSSMNEKNEILLSNFIEGQPNKNTDVQPIVKFYVNTGSYKPGTVVNFTSSSATAALCDATSGKLVFMVIYNADGTWTVT